MFANQGLYNGFLAAGLIWGLVLGLNPIGYMVQLFFVICVVVAAIFGGFTSNKSIIVKQGLPAVLKTGRPFMYDIESKFLNKRTHF